jgi:citrate synthase
MSQLLRRATEPALHRGLEGVVVDESELSVIDGSVGELRYRGYRIEDLAEYADYEEVLHLLWHGQLPDETEYEAFRTALATERAVDDGVLDVVRELAAQDEDPMAALRTAVSMLSAYDTEPDADPADLDAALRKGLRITAKIPTIVAAFERFRQGEAPVEPREDLGHAANFLYMLTGTAPDAVAAETFDMALVLHADHGLNASTFSAMVTASTLSDLHSAVTSAIGTLAGSLHGGANANVMRMLREVDESDVGPTEWVENALEEGRRVSGFGHRVYNVKDPRAKILGEKSKSLAEAAGDTKWYDYSVAIEEYMAELPCPACDGARLRPEALAVTIDGTHIIEATRWPVERSLEWIQALQGDDTPLDERAQAIGERVLREVHDRARHMDKAGMLLIEHRPTDQKPQWLCLTRLTTALDTPRTTSLLELFKTYYVRQVLTKKSPSHAWQATQRKAWKLNRVPLLVTAIHGTRTGTCLAPRRAKSHQARHWA